MIDPAFTCIALAVGGATALTVAVSAVVTASRTKAVLDVLVDVADMMELEQRRLTKIRKLRRITSAIQAQHRSNGSLSPAVPVVYAPRHNYDEGGKR